MKGHLTAHYQYKIKMVKLVKKKGQKGKKLFLYELEWLSVFINIKRNNICVFYPKAKKNFFGDILVNMIYLNIFSLIGTF